MISVLPIGPFDSEYSYDYEGEITPGTVVSVPLLNREVLGIVQHRPTAEIPKKTLKVVSKVHDISLPQVIIDFIDWVARYTMSPRGYVLKMVLAEPTLFTSKKPIELTSIPFELKDILLTKEQIVSYTKISEILESKVKSILFHGVTGSGKTEVFLKLAQDVINQGKQVLILLPEIALTQQMSDRIKNYFGVEPIIWNSSVTPKNRRAAWMMANSCEVSIVIGSRSALFLPFRNLGLIVVDEEHDGSYKQTEFTLYNARDMAIVRAQLSKIPIILTSATPSLESFVNAETEKYRYVSLNKRFGNSQYPEVHLIDLKNEKSKNLISEELKQKVDETLTHGKQVLLYLNRRGYSQITICKSCGHKINCPHCSVMLAFHRRRSRLICHYCGHSCSAPKSCPSCNIEDKFVNYGAGVEKLLEEAKATFPNQNIIIASSDTMDTYPKVQQIINQINSGEANIIVATQILAKGHHFKNLNTIGIIDGDFGLDRADIRAVEHMNQLFHQLVGRAGRESETGKVYIQTYDPLNPVFTPLKTGDMDMLLSQEVEIRKKYDTPPYSRIVAVIISGTNEESVEKVAYQMVKNRVKHCTMLGPAPSPIFKIAGKVRWRILIKSAKNINIQKCIHEWLEQNGFKNHPFVKIDVDPINFL